MALSRTSSIGFGEQPVDFFVLDPDCADPDLAEASRVVDPVDTTDLPELGIRVAGHRHELNNQVEVKDSYPTSALFATTEQ